jgi:hypothetical protein
LTPASCEGVTAPRADYTVREMEAADWASLSDQDLLERRISKLGFAATSTTPNDFASRCRFSLSDEIAAQSLLVLTISS